MRISSTSSGVSALSPVSVTGMSKTVPVRIVLGPQLQRVEMILASSSAAEQSQNHGNQPDKDERQR